MSEKSPPSPSDEKAPPEKASPRPIYTTGQLFGKTREITITHRGECYQLRITRQEKLILTK